MARSAKTDVNTIATIRSRAEEDLVSFIKLVAPYQVLGLSTKRFVGGGPAQRLNPTSFSYSHEITRRAVLLHFG